MSAEPTQPVQDTEPEKDTKTEESDTATPAKPEVNVHQMEQIEEAKLKAKFPQAMRPGGSSFLQKRLAKGQKYFDSGDYNMAKAKGTSKAARLPVLAQTTGDAIPTPDNLPTRKTSLVQSKLAAGLT